MQQESQHVGPIRMKDTAVYLVDVHAFRQAPGICWESVPRNQGAELDLNCIHDFPDIFISNFIIPLMFPCKKKKKTSKNILISLSTIFHPLETQYCHFDNCK